MVRMVKLCYDINDNVNTREELIELMKVYKNILNSAMVDYLNSLINLEFSAIRDYISDDERMALSELEVYKKIIIYNIYNRTLNLFNKSSYSLNIFGNQQGNKGLDISINIGDEGNCVKLFDFKYDSRDGKPIVIGNVSLFQTIENKEVVIEEIDKLIKRLRDLYNIDKTQIRRLCLLEGITYAQWICRYKQEIVECEKMLKLLRSKRELTDEENKEIEITRQFNTLILEDYGLNDKHFKLESDAPFIAFDENAANLQKTLVLKKVPNIVVLNNIKYI